MTVKRKLFVIALGGNALNSPDGKGDYQEQVSNANFAARAIATILKNRSFSVVITHGNGPQVGNILLQQELSKDGVIPLPLSVCGAESQGMIGTILVSALDYALDRVGIAKIAVTVVTHVVVDINDPAFKNPTKPIGMIYPQTAVSELVGTGYAVKEVKPGCFRRVVASPRPLRVVELDAIKCLLKKGIVPVAVGGGGIPVIDDNGWLERVDAVIDKDSASGVLAAQLNADCLVILTNVPAVALNFGKADQKWLEVLAVNDAKYYLEQGQFSAGSMGPKVAAAISFIENGGQEAIIASLNDIGAAILGKAGTRIVRA